MSGIHTTEVKILIEFQAKDSAIDVLNKKISFFPEEIESINEQLEEQKIAIQETKNLLIQIQVEKKIKSCQCRKKKRI